MIEKLSAENEGLEKRVEGFQSGGIELVSEDQILETFKA